MDILFFITVAGQIADEAGMLALRSAINMFGEAGYAELSIYDLAKDPKNDPFILFGYALSSLGGGKPFVDAANTRRGLADRGMNSLKLI